MTAPIFVMEMEDVLDARIVAERIASSLERFGTTRFKGIGHKVMSDVMGAGALGIEIIISGKGNKQRVVSIIKPLRDGLDQYLAWRRKSSQKHSALYP